MAVTAYLKSPFRSVPGTIQSGLLVGVMLLAVPVFANQTYSGLASAAAHARREGKSSALVDDIQVDPIVFSNPDDQFRQVGAVVVSIVQVDIAQVVTPDSAYKWTKGKVDRVLHNGRAEGLETICAGIPRPRATTTSQSEVVIPLRRGSAVVDGVTLIMNGWQAKAALKVGSRYLIFGGYCAADVFWPGVLYPVRDDGTLGPSLGPRSQLIESKRTLNGVASYLNDINKRPGSSPGNEPSASGPDL